MTKIVYNGCHGGFSLSEKAVLRYGELKGLRVYIEHDKRWSLPTFWTVPEEQRPQMPEGDAWYALTTEERIACNNAYKAAVISDRDIPRDDQHLVQVVEELGEEANGRHAALCITEVPTGTKYRIDEYDGSERVMTIDDYEWQTA